MQPSIVEVFFSKVFFFFFEIYYYGSQQSISDEIKQERFVRGNIVLSRKV